MLVKPVKQVWRGDDWTATACGRDEGEPARQVIRLPSCWFLELTLFQYSQAKYHGSGGKIEQQHDIMQSMTNNYTYSTYTILLL